MKKRQRFRVFLLMLVLSLVLPFATVYAEEATLSETIPSTEKWEEGWKFRLTPFLWLPGVNGTVNDLGAPTDIGVNFGDLLQNLKMTFMLAFAADYGPWIFDFRGVYLHEGSSTSFLNSAVEGDLYMVLTEYDATFRSDRIRLGSGLYPRMFVGVTGGLRYTYMKVQAGITGRNSRSASKNLFDFYGGLLVGFDFLRWLSLNLSADAGSGGGAIGSDLSWSAEGDLVFHVWRHVGFPVGYRAVGYELSSSRAISLENMIIHGPVVGVEIIF